ncbi:ATPase [Arthrobacter sp. Soil782]|uniref:ABC transporter permease n=1 Tax=Arthrobacter sp. Soil782 TaxID=1736410 RepID=UPI0006FF7FD1|nr:ABC transporter permease [Arthrobacter sp. Soil782]KRF06351.1 ATPase [Arthrobacter sp. Soil782]
MTTTATSTGAARPKLKQGRALELAQSYGVIGVLLLLSGISALLFPSFATSANISAIATAACFIGLITIGQSFVLISGGIDLSVGSMVGLGTVIAALAAPLGWMAALGAPILAGAAMGLVNGLLIGKARMAPFIVTLSALLAIKGIAVALASSSIIIDSSNGFTRIGNGSFLGISNLIWILVLAFAAAGLLLNRTAFGSSVFALGGNEDAAKMMGTDVTRIKVIVYIISGALAGLAGALLASRLSSGVSTLGTGYELISIAAAVIGGVLLTGGVGTMLGALCGVLLIGVIQNIINQVGSLNAYYQDLVTGLFLVLAVIVQGILSNRRRK